MSTDLTVRAESPAISSSPVEGQAPATSRPAIPIPKEGERCLRLSRRELYDLVWSHSALQMSKAWNISDVAIAKKCRRYNIPKPKLGDWARVQHGYKIKRPRLPNPSDNSFVEIRVFARRDNVQVKVEPVEIPMIPVPSELRDPHPSVAKTQDGLRRAKPGQRGLIQPRNKGAVPVKIGPSSVERVLLFLDTLAKACEERGFRFHVETKEEVIDYGYQNHFGSPSRPAKRYTNRARIEVFGEGMTLIVAERAKRDRADSQAFCDHVPNGNLYCQIDPDSFVMRREWSDRKVRKLEDEIGKIISALTSLAHEVKERRRNHEEAEARRAKEQKQREELERLQLVETRRCRQFDRDIANWRHALDGSALIASVREALDRKKDAAARDEVRRWLEWAEKRVAKIDPLHGGLPKFSKYGQDPSQDNHDGDDERAGDWPPTMASRFPYWLKHR